MTNKENKLTIPPTPNERTFVSASVIAERYGISSRYVLKLAADGEIPSLRLGKKCVRFDQEAVADSLEGGS